MIFCELLNDVVPLDVRIGISGARDLEREPLNGMAVRMGRACRASFAGIYQIDLRKCTDGVLSRLGNFRRVLKSSKPDLDWVEYVDRLADL